MIDQIKAKLKAKFPKVNLSTKRIDAIADRLHKKFPELKEEEIEGKLDDLNDLNPFDEIAKEDDRVRTLEAKLNEKPEPPKPADPKPNDPKPKSEMDELKELVRGLATTVQTLNAEKQQQSLHQKLKTHEKLKDIPEKFWNKRQLPKDEEIDIFVDEVSSDYAEILPQAQPNNPFVPGVGRQRAPAPTVAGKEVIKSIVSKL